jgi:hypothetical protein
MSNTITGNFKAFYKNYLVQYGQSIAVSSGSTTAANMYDFDRSTRWLSSGSSDVIQESIVISFDSAQTINRICLLNTNFKKFTIKYDNAGWQNFTNVYSKKTDNSPVTGISITTNSDIARYFEFDSVTTSSIQILIDTTITANAEKYLYELYIGYEIGTFISDLAATPNDYKPMASYKRAQYLEKSNGGLIKIERANKYQAKVNLKQIWDAADIVILQTMFDYGEFAIYPCGAYDQYTTERGWRIQDLYHVLIKGDEESEFDIGRDKNLGQNFKFDLLEL